MRRTRDWSVSGDAGTVDFPRGRDLATFTPEQKMWAKVYEEAIAQAKRAGTTIATNQSDEALAWILEEADYVGSFEWVCVAILLDPSYIREQLIQIQAKGISNGKAPHRPTSTRAQRDDARPKRNVSPDYDPTPRPRLAHG